MEKFTRRDMYTFIQNQKWIFAKTYAAYAPHEYIVREYAADKEAFDKAGEFILENGMRMFYYKHERKYLFCDGWFYWILRSEDNPSDAVINRCKPEDYDVVFMQKGTQAKKYGLNEKKAHQMKLEEIL